MYGINITEIIVLFFSISLLTLVNYININYHFKLIINGIFFSESFVLTFFFQKFNSFFSFVILLFSLYNIIALVKREVIQYTIVESIFSANQIKYFQHIGFFLFFSVLFYEYHADRVLSTNGSLIIILSLLFFSYNHSFNVYVKEKELLLVFTFLLSFLFIFTEILYKLLFGFVGDDSGENWIDRDISVYYMLGKPLASFLSLLGYNVYSSGSSIFFENLETHTLVELGIAEGCSGIASIMVFTSLFLSYIVVDVKKFNFGVFFFLILGFFMAYISNLLRMSIIVLVGHYKGMESLEFVHQYLGWLIFTGWMLIFWYLFNGYIHNIKERIK